jgi:hypothetical protein
MLSVILYTRVTNTNNTFTFVYQKQLKPTEFAKLYPYEKLSWNELVAVDNDLWAMLTELDREL